MIGLVYDCLYGVLPTQTKDLELSKKHPQEVMKILNISYNKAVPQSMLDCWWFLGVEGDLDNLPEFIEANDFGDLSSKIGFGLSKEDVLSLQGFVN